MRSFVLDDVHGPIAGKGLRYEGGLYGARAACDKGDPGMMSSHRAYSGTNSILYTVDPVCTVGTSFPSLLYPCRVPRPLLTIIPSGRPMLKSDASGPRVTMSTSSYFTLILCLAN